MELCAKVWSRYCEEVLNRWTSDFSRNTTRAHGENCQEVYPEASLLQQVKGVGTQIALTYVLTIENPVSVSEESRGRLFFRDYDLAGRIPGRANHRRKSAKKETGIREP